MMTLAPSRAKLCAQAKPMPLDAPVTSTERPLSSRSKSHLLRRRRCRHVPVRQLAAGKEAGIRRRGQQIEHAVELVNAMRNGDQVRMQTDRQDNGAVAT